MFNNALSVVLGLLLWCLLPVALLAIVVCGLWLITKLHYWGICATDSIKGLFKKEENET